MRSKWKPHVLTVVAVVAVLWCAVLCGCSGVEMSPKARSWLNARIIVANESVQRAEAGTLSEDGKTKIMGYMRDTLTIIQQMDDGEDPLAEPK